MRVLCGRQGRTTGSSAQGLTGRNSQWAKHLGYGQNELFLSDPGEADGFGEISSFKATEVDAGGNGAARLVEAVPGDFMAAGAEPGIQQGTDLLPAEVVDGQFSGGSGFEVQADDGAGSEGIGPGA